MKFFSRFFNKKYMTVTDENGKLNIFGLAIPLFLESIGVHLVGVVQKHLQNRLSVNDVQYFLYAWTNDYRLAYAFARSQRIFG
ncbi:MAG: hypothetical protein IJX06_04875 [Clostridia bacterium]|nr:hypothetical protein [Clostridia bacterium]